MPRKTSASARPRCAGATIATARLPDTGVNTAMSYDHRIIDGREAVLGLVTMKEALEDPSRLLLGV